MITFELCFNIKIIMRISHLAFIGISLLLLSACKEEIEKPKVIYDASKTGRELTKADSTQIKIADLPIQMEGTDYLIHPVGDLSVYEKGTKNRYGSSSVNDLSFT